MNDIKTACPKCGKKEKPTLHHSGLAFIDKNGTVPVKCSLCGWKGRVFVKAEFGLLKEEGFITCTKEHPWDGRMLPMMHVDADFMDDTGTFKCPNCGHIWSLGPDV